MQQEIGHFIETTGIPCETDLEAVADIPPHFREPALRVIAEGLHNVIRHAQAQQVWISIARSACGLTLEVRDDGVGFESVEATTQAGHYGLVGLRERARLSGGTDELMIRGLQAGAAGYLLKDCSSETLLSAIRTAARGEMIVQSETLTRLLSYAARGVSPSKTGTTHEEFDLTEREREILTAVAQGKRGKEIAAQLHIADRTVRAHLTNIYAKLGVDSRTSAVAMALERGLLPRQHTGGNRDE